MEYSVLNFFAGAAGGVARALVGTYKAKKNLGKKFKFDLKSFVVSCAEAFASGALFGATQMNPLVAFVGAAGVGSIMDKIGLQFKR